ncbi:hypothetical protein HAX54_025536, partial [Datura stramonium]|nr:hypothetical protein [Datura stramonium]
MFYHGFAGVTCDPKYRFASRDKSLAHRTAQNCNLAAFRGLPPAFRHLSRRFYRCLLLIFHL